MRRAVILTGARQTGKTTLVRRLLPQEGVPAVYLNLDDPDERSRLMDNPVARLDLGEQLVAIDEVQKLPQLMDVVKLHADRPEGPRFLLLGSSQILLLKQVRETLAGRVTLLHLWPLAVGERVRARVAPHVGMDRLFERGEGGLKELARALPPVERSRELRASSEQTLLWGGFPSVETLATDQQRRTWLRDYRSTYLERDLGDLGQVADLDNFALAQNLLAARTAQILSYSEVSRELGVAVNTVKRYVRFLEISNQVFLLKPYAPRISKRLVKSPKLYWVDTGLARILSERFDAADGALYETFVAGELLKWLSWQEEPPHIGFYRTHAGAEVDFVLWSEDVFIAIEAKATKRVHPGAARNLERFLGEVEGETVAQRDSLGLVVYRGQELRWLGENLWAVPDWLLFGGME
ncbi:MAG: ATP-binding protein [Thermoleophilia bacterium]|nr:ATP-binding protein [Thermoleophilia bacterium]